MSVKKAQELKQLQSRRSKLEADVQAAAASVREAQQQQALLNKQLQNVIKQIESMDETDIVVSEHAMLRFLERAQGLDLESIKDCILSDETRILINNLGNGKYPIGNGVRAVVKNRKIVSVI